MRAARTYHSKMDFEAPPRRSKDEMQAARDRATADVVAERVVHAREVHARLRQDPDKEAAHF